jgi:hypothetical protein
MYFKAYLIELLVSISWDLTALEWS